MNLKLVEIRKVLDYSGRVVSHHQVKDFEIASLDESEVSEMLCKADLAGTEIVASSFPDFPNANTVPTAIDLIYWGKVLPESSWLEFKNGWKIKLVDRRILCKDYFWTKQQIF